ncbi:MAG: histidinol dehydrogenase [Gammaproteobacteria bacterium]|nr:histidinol dehydrogenase [Gammaproteobacteria bacterium]
MNKNSRLIQRLEFSASNFQKTLDDLLFWEPVSDPGIVASVQQTLNDIRKQGDKALVELTQRFDHFTVSSIAELEITPERCQHALASLLPAQQSALQQAAERIRAYAERQKLASWSYQENNGSVFGQQVMALERVGIYVPGGKAAYPSSVLMNAIPAKVAGVQNIIMTSPTPSGTVNPMVLAAAALAGVDRVFTVGGAQAIAALAYGTETLPAVDKIVGPGNAYVAAAKRLVFGKVGIDMIAGPSEVLILADSCVDPKWVVTDMFAQAEHDEDAQAIVISTESHYLDQIESHIKALLPERPRSEVIRKSLSRRGALIHVESINQAIDLINRIAPEHLELATEDAEQISKKIRHAGAIFISPFSAEVFGDYCAGPNHVLPTSGTARFSSPLGVYDFQKRSSIIACSKEGAQELSTIASTLARSEGLIAHAESAEIRSKTT